MKKGIVSDRLIRRKDWKLDSWSMIYSSSKRSLVLCVISGLICSLIRVVCVPVFALKWMSPLRSFFLSFPTFIGLPNIDHISLLLLRSLCPNHPSSLYNRRDGQWIRETLETVTWGGRGRSRDSNSYHIPILEVETSVERVNVDVLVVVQWMEKFSDNVVDILT